MTMFTGTVDAVNSKEVKTKFGPKPTFSFLCGGKWIKTGFKSFDVQVGYQVDFDATEGSYGWEAKAVNILSRGTTGSSPSPSASAGSSAAAAIPVVSRSAPMGSGYRDKVFPIPPLHGDRSIVRQNALARSTDLYIHAKGGKPFEMDSVVCDLVIRFARTFEAYTAGDLDMAEALREDTAAHPVE